MIVPSCFGGVIYEQILRAKHFGDNGVHNADCMKIIGMCENVMCENVYQYFRVRMMLKRSQRPMMAEMKYPTTPMAG